MHVAIVSNITAGIGLTRDFELLRDLLRSAGHEVDGLQYDDPIPDGLPAFELAIFLEVVPRAFLNIAPVNWLFANPEWVKPEMIRLIERNIDKVFAKTKEGERLLKPLFGARVHFTGFCARDQYDPAIQREPIFLHVGGNSSIRGTQAVLDAWRWRKNGKSLEARLIIVSSVLQDRPDLPNVTIFERVTDEELKNLQNRCAFHLCPSMTEGYGHILHESLGVDAFVISTDAPPMNEFGAVLRLPARKAGRYNLADLYEVSALDIFEAAQNIEQIYLGEVEQDSRKLFLQENQTFREVLDSHLRDIRPHQAPAVRAANTPTRIAFLGNFLTPDSTESMVQWALEERLGVEVEPLQENKVNLRMLEEAMEWNDIFLWIHTRNFFQVPDNAMLMFLKELHQRKVPTISMHLDKFWGIPEREKRIGLDPFWRTQFVFTADGSRDEYFRKAGVQHYWMKPAMSEVYCHPGVPREEFRCDVGFVGAKGYHPEYPFRPRLVDWLEETYGGRFKHITDVRGHALNDFYASCKVVVGDCIFAGTARYWSDRVPETLGRYGFLVHPRVVGLTMPMAYYEAQNLEDLREVVDGCLSLKETDRTRMKMLCSAMVQLTDTWTVRMQQILETVKGNADAEVHKS